MSAPRREDFESDDGFYGAGVERTSDGLRLSAGSRNGESSAILSPAKAREFAHAILRQAGAMQPLPSLLDEYRATESERAAVLTVARAAAEDMRAKAKALATGEKDLADTAHCAAATEKTSAYWDARRDQAKVLEKWIGALPLPGDKP